MQSTENNNLKIETITPTMAKGFLKRNVNNRPLKKNTILRLTEAIKRGEFVFNGDAIRFNEKGDLIDGQHRLSACVAADISITSLIVYDLSSDVMSSIDIGDRRTYADHLVIRSGLKDANNISSAINVVFHYNQSGLNGMNDHSKKPTYDQLDNFFDNHPGIVESLKFISPMYDRDPLKTVPRGIGGGLHYIFSNISNSRTKSDQFFIDVYTGALLEKNDPVHVLRNRIIKSKRRKEFTSKKDSCQLVIKAWNARAQSKTIKGLRLDRTEMPKVLAAVSQHNLKLNND